MSLTQLPSKRPAETSGVAAWAATFIGTNILHITDPEALAGLYAIPPVVVGVVTYLKVNGGIKGAVRGIWRGGNGG